MSVIWRYATPTVGSIIYLFSSTQTTTGNTNNPPNDLPLQYGILSISSCPHFDYRAEVSPSRKALGSNSVLSYYNGNSDG